MKVKEGPIKTRAREGTGSGTGICTLSPSLRAKYTINLFIRKGIVRIKGLIQLLLLSSFIHFSSRQPPSADSTRGWEANSTSERLGQVRT
ncbi:hypothetical protein SUGI_0605740 [Cryptomeria japonica]|nr:hypothetical protein SUGI_0605740 [Cryptomeria japonica]